jgi:hypothetical protein
MGLAALGKMLIDMANMWPLILAARVIVRTGKRVQCAPRLLARRRGSCALPGCGVRTAPGRANS